MRIEKLSDGVTLYCGDCREVLPTLGKVDVVVTSPPYGQQRDYGKKIEDWRALVSPALSGISLVPDGQILVNLGVIHRDGEVVPYWQHLIDDMRSAGWRHFGWYVWDQGPGLPGDWMGRLAPSHEFIFHFNKSSRILNKIVPCTHAGKSRGTKSGLRAVDGSITGWSAEDLTTQEFRIGDSVVRTVRHKHVGGIEAGHPAVFPVSLPQELISSFTAAGQVVLDPFMGSGTTGVAAAKLGRCFVGMELEPKYFDIACCRIADALARPDLFIEPPKPATQQSWHEMWRNPFDEPSSVDPFGDAK